MKRSRMASEVVSNSSFSPEVEGADHLVVQGGKMECPEMRRCSTLVVVASYWSEIGLRKEGFIDIGIRGD